MIWRNAESVLGTGHGAISLTVVFPAPRKPVRTVTGVMKPGSRELEGEAIWRVVGRTGFIHLSLQLSQYGRPLAAQEAH